MRKLTFGMNLSLDGYIAAPGDDLGWSGPSDELFQWWLDQERAIGLLLYGRKLWEAMSSYWPTGDQQPNATPAQIEFAPSDLSAGRVVTQRPAIVRIFCSCFRIVPVRCDAPVGEAAARRDDVR